jgi:C4-dicarboxylate transporter DctQ subunit
MVGRIVNSIEEGLIAFLLATMTLVTFSQVVARYVFNTGAVWALELTVYLFAWLVLIGMSYGVKIGVHLGVDAFVKIFPPRGQKILTILAALACIAYAVIMLVGAWDYFSKIHRFGIGTEDLYVPRIIVEGLYPGEDYEEIPIPRWIPYSALPLGLALLLFRFVQATWQVITGRREHITASHEAEDLVREAHDVLDVPGEEDAIPTPHADYPDEGDGGQRN